MKIGAHVSTAGGAHKAIDNALTIGAECIQIFASSPRAWAFKPQKPEAIGAFRARSEETGIGPAFLHGSYLVNLGGDDELVAKSIGSLTAHMNAATELGAKGVIFHSGSNKGKGFDAVLDQAVAAMTQVLANTSEETWLIIENSAGAGNHIGATFEEIGRMIAGISSDRVRVCIDTQHTLAAGYDITTSSGIDSVMNEFDSAIGLDRLAAVHANDSKTELGSGKDRHENIGLGSIGSEGFANIMAHPAFADVPFMLEVPGIEGNGPDVPNIDALKAIRARLSD
jgi:deoxyribonuclease-4